MINEKNLKWYLGLDTGTDSVGWAATNEEYKVLKYKNNAMWGVMLFDSANQSSERRSFRTARRRLDRRQQRIVLLQQLFAKEIAKKDEKFFTRLKESALYAEDKSTNTSSLLFCDADYTDNDYHKDYPTIHHLISELMKNKEPHDVRLVYLACAYILAHRGHFLIDVDKSNIDGVTDFNIVYHQLLSWFDSMEYSCPWECAEDAFCAIMKKKLSVTAKEREFKALLWNGGKPSDAFGAPVSAEHIISMLSGRKTKLSDLFANEEYKDLENNTVCLGSPDFSDVIGAMASSLDNSEVELLEKMKALFDWSLLTEMLNGEKVISDAKVKTYMQHEEDLKFLKHIIREYVPSKYNEVFREASDKTNYTSYSYNIKSVKTKIPDKFKKCKNSEDFCKYISSIVKDITVKDCDKERFDDMTARLALNSFCPKQVNTNNRVIPYQLYWSELKTILDNACGYLDFLNESDDCGSVKEKILTLMEFRIPYYVGPLVARSKNDNSWIVRKKDGKIYPWNFDEMVDKDACEQEFIRRMTCKCTYLAGKDVLPKNSLLYSKFNVLNEINNIKINDIPIDVNCKQRIYEELFMRRRNVSRAAIEKFLVSNGYMKSGNILSGIDITVKSSLKSYHDFKELIASGRINESDAERIIERITYTDDKRRLRKWLEESFTLTKDEVKYISSLRYSDFGRLSGEFLTEIADIDPQSGEIINPSIISMLWQTNDNLMQLLSERYNYSRYIERMNAEYYDENPSTIMQRLDDMYISNAVKRPIIRTLDIVKELHGIMATEPEKIFIEMARDTDKSKKGKRTVSRKDQITELYKNYDKKEVSELLSQLESKSDSELRSEKLFLYFTQLGRCMYSGQKLDINKLGTTEYNIDHIYPQARIKDDSLDNKVLVLSEINGQKKDIYPIDVTIRDNMHAFWETLYEKNLISDIKRKRLERNVGFTDDELAGFISRQLVETRQSTKAVARLLSEIFPDTDIVYVKAGLVSEFRHEYDMLKCREINDLHHAKDAYLNIVMGNVYNVKFTKSPLNFIKGGGEYTLNLKPMLEHDISRGGVTAWKGNGVTLSQVRNTMNKNNIRYVKYALRRNGGFYHQNPERASDDSETLIEIKKGMDVRKYGGYNNSTATCFRLVKYITKRSAGAVIIPIELLYASQIACDKEFAKEYCMNVVSKIITLKKDDVLLDIQFPLGERILKINSVLEVDGFRCTIVQKSNKGKTLVIASTNSLVCDNDTNNYIKSLASFAEKSENGRKFSVDPLHSNINADSNLNLYDYLYTKLTVKPFSVMFSKVAEKIKNGRPYFEKLTLTEQSLLLLNMVNILKTGRSAGCDLRMINDKEKAAIVTLNSDLSKLKGFSEIRIIDRSPTGLFEKKSVNLLEL